jgi:glycosyltransferase involved in cell wall biosynthesis
MPAVTIILPVRDGATTLPRALASIRAQTWSDWELLAVDDGSSDGTGKILAATARHDARVRVISASRPGLVPALNAGLGAASGDFIARMDADDESHPERLAGQIAMLQGEPALGVVGCLVACGGDRTTGEGYALHVDWLNTLITPEQIALNRFIESPHAHPSVMFRRAAVERHGGYREGDFPEDYELWLRWLDAGVRMAKVPRALLTWHDSPARLSRTDARYAPDAFYRVKAPWIARELGRIAGGRAVWIWGAGRPTRKRAAELEGHGVRIAGYIDVDPKKTGRKVGGVPVVAPDGLPEPGAVFVLGYVATRGARDLIRGELTRRRYGEGRDFLMCA